MFLWRQINHGVVLLSAALFAARPPPSTTYYLTVVFSPFSPLPRWIYTAVEVAAISGEYWLQRRLICQLLSGEWRQKIRHLISPSASNHISRILTVDHFVTLISLFVLYSFSLLLAMKSYCQCGVKFGPLDIFFFCFLPS